MVQYGKDVESYDPGAEQLEGLKGHRLHWRDIFLFGLNLGSIMSHRSRTWR